MFRKSFLADEHSPARARDEQEAALNKQIRIVNLQLDLTGAAEAEECSQKCNNRFGWLCRKYQDISLAVMQHFLPLGRHITLLFYPLASLQLHAQKMVAYSNMRIVRILSYRETA